MHDIISPLGIVHVEAIQKLDANCQEKIMAAIQEVYAF